MKSYDYTFAISSPADISSPQIEAALLVFVSTGIFTLILFALLDIYIFFLLFTKIQPNAADCLENNDPTEFIPPFFAASKVVTKARFFWYIMEDWSTFDIQDWFVPSPSCCALLRGLISGQHKLFSQLTVINVCTLQHFSFYLAFI